MKKLSDLATTDVENYQFFSDMIANPQNYNIDISNSWDNALDSDINNYYYFSEKGLEKIGLKNQNRTVIINFKTRNVIEKKGVKYKDKRYYRQYDLSGGEKLKS